MLGAIIGDICGSIYEFDNETDVKKIKLFGKGCFPTDDSIMSIAVSRALIDSKGRSETTVKETLVNSMHYFGRLFPHAGYGRTFQNWLLDYKREPYNSWGNGSAMRVSSVGWLYNTLEDTLYMARLTSEVTHNHLEGVKGAEAIAACIFLAREGKTKEEIRKYITTYYYKLDFTIDEIRDSYTFDESCQGSCPQAIAAFLEGKDFKDVIIKSISIGGDSDTIAAMAGGIAEAYYGIPDDMVKKALEHFTYKEDALWVYNNSIIYDELLKFYRYLEDNNLKSPRSAAFK